MGGGVPGVGEKLSDAGGIPAFAVKSSPRFGGVMFLFLSFL